MVTISSTGAVFGNAQLKELATFSPKERETILKRVIRIEKKSFPTSEAFDFTSELRKKHTNMIIAVKDGDASELIGYLVYLRVKRLTVLHKICVVEQEREKGVGKCLIHSLRLLVEKGGCDCIHLAIVMLVATIALFVSVAIASPQVNFPLNLQYPPVARVGEMYNFQFASTTFGPNPEKLQYSLIKNPSWLSINGDKRTLWGTPGAGDVGTIAFTIAAAAEAGAVANMESKLLVTEGDGPRVKGNISEQLSKAGQLSGPRSVTLPPSKLFEVKFAQDTFQTTGKSLSYHASLEDHTPLPAWISFDAQSLRFAGTTPLSTAPQSFDILLIASDTAEYAAATTSFSLFVSNHQFLFRPLTQTLNLSKGEHVKISDVKSKLFLDDAPIRDGDIQSAGADLPSWLFFDNHSFDITGDPPSGLMSQDLGIIVQDKFGDTAKHSIHLSFMSQFFTSEIGQLNITAGERFEYNIPRNILTKDNDNVSVSVGLGDLGQWLSFNSNTFSISGTVPKDFSPRMVEGSMTARTSDGASKDTQTFQLLVSGAGTHVYPGATATGSGPSQPTESGSSSIPTDNSKRNKAGIIAGSVLSAVVAATILFAFIFFLCCRKKQEKGYISPRSPRSPRKTDISRPIPIVDEWRDLSGDHDVDLEKGKGDDGLERAPEHPPRIHLDLSTKREDSHSPASSIGEPETKILTAFDRSSWGFQDGAGPSHHPHDSMKIPTEMARKESEQSSSPLMHKRCSTKVYRDTPRRSSGLPLNRRLRGLGHGRHTYSPSRSSNNFAVFRRPLSYTSGTTNSVSFVSTTPSAFPQPPTARHTTQLTTPIEKRRSIRLVPKSTCDSLLDRRTIDEKRNSYIRKRASTQSPFFSAGSSRMSSSSYKFPPAFIGEATPSPKAVLRPLSSNIVKPSDNVVEGGTTERKIPESLRIRLPAETPSSSTDTLKYPGSLRKSRPERSFMLNNTESVTAANRDCVQEQYECPGTALYSRTGIGRRACVRQSLRAQELKSSLNELTGSMIFEDAEMSESVYSDEEEDIEEYEKRTTITPSQYMLPPLNLNVGDRKRSSKRDSKRYSKRESRRELKRTSQRDPTPYSLVLEHGGKENHSSTYSLANATSTATARAKGKAKSTSSPERPKSSAGLRHIHAAQHTRAESRTTVRPSAHRDCQDSPLSRRASTKERHSRKSIHSRQQSRQSATVKQPRDRSRTQSSAFPYFDASSVLVDPSK
ncbi:hypothetical protein BU26DRAFT_412890, partial [Trematosphaeria pertusa]